ncbi:MAG: hypothetical protein JWO00_177 [Candidatus Parcubacteria bacterium]|nr:hypothetical protein [Candidatus Parcubacteria bacterium]
MYKTWFYAGLYAALLSIVPISIKYHFFKEWEKAHEKTESVTVKNYDEAD